MRDNMTTYFAKWYNELDSLSPELKASSEEKLKAVEKRYSQIEEGLSKAAEKFRPLVGELTGIQNTLKTAGLTSSSVASVSDKSNSTQYEMLSLHEDLKKLLTQILETRQMLGAAEP